MTTATDDVFAPLTRTDVDPLPWLADRREESAVARLDLFGNPVWLVTRHADVRAVLGDPASYSNDFAHLGAAAGEDPDDLGLADPGGLGFRDPPEHTRLRRMLASAFTARRVAALAPAVQRVVDQRLDALEAAGPGADLVTQFATPVPAMVIGELLGVSEAEQESFAQLASGRFDLLESIGAPLDSAAQSLEHLRGLIAVHRARPRPGLLAELISSYGADADDADDQELAGLIDGLLVGGQETTASMLALGALLLLRDPQRADHIRTDPTAINATVEELLRHLSVVQVAFPRFATAPLELDGQHIAPGDLVLCSLAGANRDPRLLGLPDQLDVNRAPTPHVAFGYGIHHCLGAPLARLELQIAYLALLRRFPTLHVDIADDALTFRQRSIVFGLESLPVRW